MDYRLTDLNLLTGQEVINVIKDIQVNVTSLNLSANYFYHKTGAELAETFAAIPATVTCLDLRCNQLQNLSVESINKLINALPNVQTIYLDEAEIKAMDLTQRSALKAVLSTIPNIVLLDYSGNALDGTNPKAQHYFAGTLGITQSIPPLVCYAAFFVQHDVESELEAKKLDKDTGFY